MMSAFANETHIAQRMPRTYLGEQNLMSGGLRRSERPRGRPTLGSDNCWHHGRRATLGRGRGDKFGGRGSHCNCSRSRGSTVLGRRQRHDGRRTRAQCVTRGRGVDRGRGFGGARRRWCGISLARASLFDRQIRRDRDECQKTLTPTPTRPELEKNTYRTRRAHRRRFDARRQGGRLHGGGCGLSSHRCGIAQRTILGAAQIRRSFRDKVGRAELRR
jgi:hypothetical protein